METGRQPEYLSTEEIKKTHRNFELTLTERGKPAVDSALKYLANNHSLRLPKETKYGYLYLIYSDGHNNNNLVVVNPESGKPKYVIKIFKKDYKNPSRYDREQKTFNLLKQSGLFPKNLENQISIPEIIHYNHEHQYTIQRFVEGTRIPDTAATKEHIKLMAEFIARIHSITPSTENKNILPFPATDPVSTPYHIYINYLKRMQDFFDYFNSNTEFHKTFLDQLEKWDIKQRLADTETKIINNIGLLQLHRETPPEETRINQNDTSFFNIKNASQTGEDPKLYVFDFEYAGWDNPFDMVANFVHHAQSEGISQELKQLFVDEYVKKMKLTPKQITDLNARLALAHLEWVSIILRSTIPKRLRKFLKQSYMSRDEQRIEYFLSDVHKRLSENPFDIQARHPIT